MKTSVHLLTAIFLVIVSCNSDHQQNSCMPPASYFTKHSNGIQNGGVEMITINTLKGDFKVWTKTIGNNPSVKVLLVNGGPGLTHEYFECFENFLPAAGIEFIYYDQLDCGNSDHPNDTSLYDLARCTDEIEQVRKALHLDESNFFLLGHSWGGIVAIEYSLKYQSHLKGLIISDMMCSASEYDKYADDVLSKTMPVAVVDSIRLIEKNNDYSNPRYMELLMPNYYAQHICRIPVAEWPEPVQRSFSKLNSGFYVTMQGPSEFGISGKLENWERKNVMKNITVPTLSIGAKYDTMDPAHMEWISKEVKNGSFLFCENGSHMCFYDDQENYFQGLISWIGKVK
ncbi:MAG: proline iminopeptidase-family hydrolase [Bacteroidota bacterium]